MRHLRSVSVLLFLGGLVLLVGSLLLPMGPTWTLIGLLLAWAGLVKLVVVRLWQGLRSPSQVDGGPAND